MAQGNNWGAYGRGLVETGEMGTDEMASTQKNLNNTNTAGWELYESLSGDNLIIEKIWEIAYTTINRANLVINSVERMENPSSSYLGIKGEAQFLRALMYFNLVRIYSGVPIKAKRSEASDNLNMPRNTIEEVYTQIISDLTDAYRYCPEAQIQLGRVIKNSASGLLSKVYLTMASEQGGYIGSLYGPKGVAEHGGGQNHLLPVYSEVISKVTRGTTRFNWTFCTYRLQNDTSLPYEEIALVNDWDYTLGKFRGDKMRNDPYNLGPHNVPVLRAAEVCLIYAEAEAELNGVNEEAFRYLNVVRRRGEEIPLDESNYKSGNIAENPTMAGYDPTTDLEWFRLAIMNERKWELIGEGHRWYDLVRMGMLEPVLIALQAINEENAALPNNQKNKTFPGVRKVSYYHILRPLPTREIELTRYTLKQNFGYR